MRLTAAEARVLGALVEKQLTTPQLYPLTDNALIAACNQSTNRDPVVSYDVSVVRLAVRSLREQDLVRTVHRTGERSEKHRQLLDTALELSPAELSLLAVLLLRGPQTPGELRARSDRMHPFDGVEQVEQVLAGLTSRVEPLVGRLPRQPGHKEIRYVELLVDRDESPRPQAGHVDRPPRPPDQQGPPPRPETQEQDAGSPPDLAQLAHDVGELRAEVERLRALVAALSHLSESGADADG